MKTLKLLLWLAISLCGCSGLLAQVDSMVHPSDSPLFLTIDTPLPDYLDLDDYVEVLADSTGRMDLTAVQASGQFVSFDSLADEFSLPLGYRLWARLRIAHTADFPQRFVLYAGVSDSMVLYHFQGDSLKTARTGYRVLPAERDIKRGRPGGVKL